MGGDTTLGGWGRPGMTGWEGSVGSAVTVCGLKTPISSTCRIPRCEPAIRSQLLLLLMVLLSKPAAVDYHNCSQRAHGPSAAVLIGGGKDDEAIAFTA